MMRHNNKTKKGRVAIVLSLLFFLGLIIALGLSANKFDLKNIFGFLNQIKETGNEKDSKPVITLFGDTELVLGRNTPYVEPNYYANDKIDGDLTDKVIVTGDIDESTPGTYYVKYAVENSAGQVAEETRTIIIEENAIPVIEFFGLEKKQDADGSNYYEYLVDVNKSFVEPSYIATDLSTNTDLTSQVIIINKETIQTNTISKLDDDSDFQWISYSIKINDEIAVTETVKVKVVDRVKPVIKLVGQDPYYIPLNKDASYIEDGAIVTDNYDTNLTVTITGTIDYTKEGTYEITYTAKDKSGNEADSIKRTVIVADQTSPIIKVDPTSVINYVNTVTVNLNISDDGAGLDKVYYLWSKDKILTGNPTFNELEGSLFSDGNEEIKLENETGIYYLHIKAVDKSSRKNTSTYMTGPYKVDNAGPMIEITPLYTATSDTIKAFAFIYDNESGFDDSDCDNCKASYQWVKDGNSVVEGNWAPYTNGQIAEQTETGQWTLHIKATDRMGNESVVKSEVFSIGNDYPSIIIELDEEKDKGEEPVIEKSKTAIIKTKANNGETLASVKYVWLPYGQQPDFTDVNKYTSVTIGSMGTDGAYSTVSVTLNTPDTEGNYYLWVEVIDSNSNKSLIASSRVKIDNKKPVIDIDNKSTNPTIKFVTNILVTDINLDTVEYLLLPSDRTYDEDSNWETLVYSVSTEVSFDAEQWEPNSEGTYYLYIRAVDSVRNTSDIYKSQLITLNSIRPSSPNIEIQSGWSNELTVTITPSSTLRTEEEIQYCDTECGKEDNWKPYTGPFKVHENGKIYARVFNANTLLSSGNDYYKEVTNIDKDGPEVTYAIHNYNIVLKDISTSFTIKDNESKIKTDSVKYLWEAKEIGFNCANGVPTTDNWKSVTVDNNETFTANISTTADNILNGNYCLYVSAEDNAGNKISSASSYAYRVDNTNPVIIITDSVKNKDKNKTVILNVNTTNEEFGIKSIDTKWSTDNKEASEYDTITGDSGIIVEAEEAGSISISSPAGYNGTYYLYVKITDKAGNVGYKKSDAYEFMNGEPTILFDKEFGIDENQIDVVITAKDIEETIISNDNIYYKFVPVSAGEVAPNTTEFIKKVTNPVSLTDAGEYYLWVYAIDEAGNEKITKASGTFTIDNTKPIITLVNEDEYTYVEYNGTYVEPGYSAVGYDGITDLTANVNSKIYDIKGNEIATIDTKIAGVYYIKYSVTDSINSSSSEEIRTVLVRPLIVSLYENNSYVLEYGKNFTPKKATIILINDELSTKKSTTDFDVTSSLDERGFLKVGTYTLKYNYNYDVKIDKDTTISIPATELTVEVEVEDTKKPTVKFEVEDNDKYKTSHSVKVTADDKAGIKTLKYIWSTISKEEDLGLDISTDGTSFPNETELSTPIGVSGNYYLWIYVEDNNGLSMIKRSSLFRLDNEAPVITITPNESAVYKKSYSPTVKITELSLIYDELSYLWTTDSPNPSIEKMLADGYKFGEAGKKSYKLNTPTETGDYRLCIYAKDEVEKEIVHCSDILKLDNTDPIVSFSTDGNNTYELSHSTTVTVTEDSEIKVLKYLWTTSSTGITSSDVKKSFAGGDTLATPTGATGDYYLWIYVKDEAGNETLTVSNVFKVGELKVNITFSPNGNSTVAKKHSTTVTVDDDFLDETVSLKYLWTDNSTKPSTGDFSSEFTSGNTLETPVGTGDYYLWVLAKDNDGNDVIEGSNKFVVNNDEPVITLSSEDNIFVEYGGTYTLPTYSAVDSLGNSLDEFIVIGSEVIDTEVAGVYLVSYSVTDSLGNTATKSIKVIVKPLITLPYENNHQIEFGETFNPLSATVKLSEGNIVDLIPYLNEVVVTTEGTYKLGYKYEMDSIEVFNTVLDIIVADTVVPTITFTPDGNTNYGTSYTTKVDVEDLAELKTLEYAWLKKTNILNVSRSEINNTFNSGETITTPSGVSGNYYLWIYAEDNNGKSIMKRSKVFRLDNALPSISFSPNSGGVEYKQNYSVTISVTDVSLIADSLKYVWTQDKSDLDSLSYNTSFVHDEEISSPSGVTGVYYLCVYAKDALNEVKVCSDEFKIDNIAPTISFEPNGSTVYAKKRSPKVTVTDDSDVKTLKYLWSTESDETKISEGDITTTFSSGITLDSPTGEGINGDYYLWIYVEDNLGNKKIERSDVFKLDNEKPVITVNSDNNIEVQVGSSFTNPTATAEDNSGENITVTSTDDVNINTVGSYTITYTAEDSSGNIATKEITVDVVASLSPIVSFNLNGNDTYKQSHSTIVTVSDNDLIGDSLRYVWSTSSTGLTKENINETGTSFSSGDELTTPTNVTGDYYLWIYAKDNSGNEVIKVSNVFKLDNTKPYVQFSTNGNDTFKQSHSTTVNITELDLVESSLKYAWLTEANVDNINVDNINIPFDNGETLTKDKLTGEYYLYVYAIDGSGNESIVGSQMFKFDNEAPEIEIEGDNPVSVEIKTVFELPTVTVTDNSGEILTATPSGTVNTSVKGEHIITYTAKDSSGNVATKDLVVKVVDTKAPVITIPGSNPLEIELGDEFTNPTATAIDNSGEVITVTSSGYVNTSKKGEYKITYTAKDSSNNETTTDLVVNVVDTKAPVITIPGSNPLTVEIKTSFVEPTVTASDNSGEDIEVIKDGSVDVNVKGEYKITYTAKDSSNNIATKDLIVKVVDTTKPVIEIDSANPLTVEIGSGTFTVPGSMVTDNSGEILTATTSGTVNTSKKGSYTITYTAKDSSNNETTKDLVVNVVDTTKPIINISGNNPLEVEINTTYVAPIVTVTDNSNESITAIPSGTVDTNTKGSYTITYTAKDSSNNETTKDLVVNVVDKTKPVITISGNNPLEIELGSTFTTPGSSVYDNSGETLTAIPSGTVDTNTKGSYTITYTAKDSSNNETTKDLIVNVVDKTKPKVSFSPIGNSTYKKSHSTAVTVSDLDLDTSSLKYVWITSATAPAKSLINTSFANESELSTPVGVSGNYYLWIYAKDNSGNEIISGSNAFRLDNEAPEISITGGNILTVEVKSAFTVPSSTVSDNSGETITATTSGTVNTNIKDIYTITYTAKDSSGNISTKDLTVNVVDTTKPVITMNGSSSVTVVKGYGYTDLGATATDNYDGNVTSKIEVTNNVKANIVGDYTVVYTVTDNSGNKQTATRNVSVIDNYINYVVEQDLGCTTGSECYYKGANPDNYVWYRGYLWRIVKSNSNGSIKLVTAGNVSALSYNDTVNTFTDSYVQKWLNDYFYPSLKDDKNIINVSTSWCNSSTTIPSSSRLGCSNLVSSKVGLLTLDEYNLATNYTGNYLNIGERFVTMTPVGGGDDYKDNVYTITEKDEVTHANNVASNTGIRPAINVTKDTKIVSGTGTYSDPYKFKDDVSLSATELNKKLSGEYVYFAGRNWRIVSTSSIGTKIVMDSYYDVSGTVKVKAFTNRDSIVNYLNNTVYNDIFTNSYDQAKIVKNTTWYSASHTNGKNVLSTSLVESASYKYTSTIGLMRVGELLSSQSRSISSKHTYWTATIDSNNSNNVYATSYNSQAISNQMISEVAIRPVVILDKTVEIDTSKNGDGTYNNPYKLK